MQPACDKSSLQVYNLFYNYIYVNQFHKSGIKRIKQCELYLQYIIYHFSANGTEMISRLDMLIEVFSCYLN